MSGKNQSFWVFNLANEVTLQSRSVTKNYFQEKTTKRNVILISAELFVVVGVIV